MSANELVGHANATGILRSSDMEIVGRMPYSSNATFLVNMLDASGVAVTKAIYKPLRGERPLWDFEPGLYRREVAAYELSEAMGFHQVPPTVVRDGPFGEGSVQWFIEADPSVHYFTLFEERDDVHDQLKTMAVFDIVANNTDRKGGHVLLDVNSHVWGIDHGVCFSSEFKLRTVIWDFATEELSDAHKAALDNIVMQVPLTIATLLNDEEVFAVQERAGWLLNAGALPYDQSGRRVPWPLL
jgi:uncharacterized repeat protein (TIGR03843 family)